MKTSGAMTVVFTSLLFSCTTTTPVPDESTDDTVECADSETQACESTDDSAECTDGETKACDGSKPGISEQFCWEGKWGLCCTYVGSENFCDCDPDPNCWTPLVLVFDGYPIQFTTEVLGSFDLTGRAMSVGTDWPTAATPWLARDLDRDGFIDGGGELFGSATRLRSGHFAPQGFAALSELDDNLDGWLTPEDSAWASLIVWADRNADRRSQPGEMTSLNSLQVQRIDLTYHVRPVCDSRGNCGVERANFGYTDGQGQERVGEVVDVHLRSR